MMQVLQFKFMNFIGVYFGFRWFKGFIVNTNENLFYEWAKLVNYKGYLAKLEYRMEKSANYQRNFFVWLLFAWLIRSWIKRFNLLAPFTAVFA